MYLNSDNIVKDKNGEIKCFDWFDSWYSNVKLQYESKLIDGAFSAVHTGSYEVCGCCR